MHLTFAPCPAHGLPPMTPPSAAIVLLTPCKMPATLDGTRSSLMASWPSGAEKCERLPVSCFKTRRDHARSQLRRKSPQRKWDDSMPTGHRETRKTYGEREEDARAHAWWKQEKKCHDHRGKPVAAARQQAPHICDRRIFWSNC
jgi:hypothetical protein